MYWWLIYAFIVTIVLYAVSMALKPKGVIVPVRDRVIQFLTTLTILGVVFYFIMDPKESDMIQRISREQDISVGMPDF